jgi:hypothetical protein
MLLLIICAGVTCVFPLDLVKTRLQNQKVRVLISFSCGIPVLIQYGMQVIVLSMSRHENCASSYYWLNFAVPSVDIYIFTTGIHKIGFLMILYPIGTCIFC